VDYRSLKERTTDVLRELGVEIDPGTKMKALSLAQVQLVEIAKAISYDNEIIIMDEPTSAIAEKDAERLFELIAILKKKGQGDCLCVPPDEGNLRYLRHRHSFTRRQVCRY
jgi:ABC-type sugar transport system ATPase subunit